MNSQSGRTVGLYRSQFQAGLRFYFCVWLGYLLVNTDNPLGGYTAAALFDYDGSLSSISELLLVWSGVIVLGSVLVGGWWSQLLNRTQIQQASEHRPILKIGISLVGAIAALMLSSIFVTIITGEYSIELVELLSSVQVDGWWDYVAVSVQTTCSLAARVLIVLITYKLIARSSNGRRQTLLAGGAAIVLLSLYNFTPSNSNWLTNVIESIILVPSIVGIFHYTRSYWFTILGFLFVPLFISMLIMFY